MTFLIRLVVFFSLTSSLVLPLRGEVSTTITEPNTIIACDNGLEMLDWNLKFIHQAQQSIDISGCIFAGKIGRQIFSAIEERIKLVPDLQVYFMLSPILLLDEDRAVIQHLETTYPKQFHIQSTKNIPITWPIIGGIDHHSKLFIIDEKYFSIGGTNINDAQCTEGTYTIPRLPKTGTISDQLPAAMRDQDIVGKGPIAKKMRTLFHKSFSLWEHYAKTGKFSKNIDDFAKASHYFSVTKQAIVPEFDQSDQSVAVSQEDTQHFLGGPHQKYSEITKEYIRLIRSAKKEIKIANLYFVPPDDLLKALLDTVNRGIRITIITNGVTDRSPESNSYFCWAHRIAYVPMFFGKTYQFWDYWSVKNKKPKNTRIYEYYVSDVSIHKKIMIVDDHTFVIGSYNIGERSHLADYETVMVLRSPDLVQKANKIFEKDLSFSKEVSPSEAIDWYFNPSIAYLAELQKKIHPSL